MLGCPPWRRIVCSAPVAVLAALALTVPASAAGGSSHHSPQRLHPYHVGHFHSVGTHWTLKVEHLNRHASAHVRHVDAHNRPAGLGHRYVLVRISGKLTSHGIGDLAYDQSFRLLVGGHSYAPANVFLWHGLQQSGTVHAGEVVMAKVPFRVTRRDASHRMILRAVSQLDWHSPARYFRTRN
jgi:hypothetical protein